MLEEKKDDWASLVSVHVLFNMLKWKYSVLNPLAVHGAEPHRDGCLGQNGNTEVPFSLVICLPSLAFAL